MLWYLPWKPDHLNKRQRIRLVHFRTKHWMLFDKFCSRFHVYQQLTVSRTYIRNSENSFCTGTKKKKNPKQKQKQTKKTQKLLNKIIAKEVFGKWSWDLRVNWLIDFHIWLLFILIKEIIPQFSSQKMRVIVKQKIFRNMLPLIWFIFNERYKNVLPEDSIGFVIFFVPARRK